MYRRIVFVSHSSFCGNAHSRWCSLIALTTMRQKTKEIKNKAKKKNIIMNHAT